VWTCLTVSDKAPLCRRRVFSHYIPICWQIDRHTHTDRQTDTDRHIDTQTHTHTDRQTHRHTHRNLALNLYVSTTPRHLHNTVTVTFCLTPLLPLPLPLCYSHLSPPILPPGPAVIPSHWQPHWVQRHYACHIRQCFYR
jgi:hypothetical protein